MHGWNVSMLCVKRPTFCFNGSSCISNCLTFSVTVNEKDRMSLDLPESCGVPRNVHVHRLQGVDESYTE